MFTRSAVTSGVPTTKDTETHIRTPALLGANAMTPREINSTVNPKKEERRKGKVAGGGGVRG